MKIALLGADEESLLLADTAVRLGHEMVWCGDVAAASRENRPWLPSDGLAEDLADEWELLLEHPTIEGVIVGRGQASPELRGEQTTQLMRSGVALLTTFPLVDAVLAYYEADMGRCESGAVVHHFNPLVEHSLCEQLAEWVGNGHPQLGAIGQVVCERALKERSRQNVLRNFSRDAQLLGRVVGGIDRVGALGTHGDESTYSALSVQMMGPRQCPVRWAVGPVQQGEGLQLLLVGEEGRLQVCFDESGRLSAAEVSIAGESSELRVDSESDTLEPAETAVNRFLDAVTAKASASSTWPEALQAMEIADTIEISLRRGRMIDIHPQQLTEELAFKGTMAATGCGVLLLLPPLMIVVGWIAGLMGVPVARYWAHGLLAMLVVFLAVQFLPKLLAKRPPPE